MTTKTRPRRAAGAAKSPAKSPIPQTLLRIVNSALDDMKAVNVRVLDVRGVTDIADCMIIASGNSDRHVRSIADRVVERCKAAGFRPYGREGERDAEWVLVDLNDVIVHVMLPRVREFYGLEELWEPPPASAKKAPAAKAGAARKKSAAPARRAKGSAPRPARGKAPAKRKTRGGTRPRG
jgi:ribosome-associated protein